MTSIQPDNSISNHQPRKLLLVIAIFFLGQALQYGNGFISLAGILFLTISITHIILSVSVNKKKIKIFKANQIHALMISALIWQIFQLLTNLPSIEILETKLAQIWEFQLLIALSGTFALISLISVKYISQKTQRFAVFLTFTTFLSAGIWVIQASPNPHIDVFTFQQTSSKALLRGENPYQQITPNIYGEKTSLYGEELKNGDYLNFSNPYPPLSIYISTLGYIVGKDIRYSHLAAILIVAILINLNKPNLDSLLISYLFLFMPRTFFVLGLSWTEPIVLFFTTIAILSAVKNSKWLPYALGLMIASKQYYVFLFPFLYFLIPVNTTWRKLLKPLTTIIATGLIITAFLALWDIPSFLWNVGIIQWYQPFRTDALSFAVLYAHLFQQYPPNFLPFIALFAAFMLARYYLPPSSENFALALSLGLGVFFAFNKQAFCNYYFLLLGILSVAAAILPPFSNIDKTKLPISSN